MATDRIEKVLAQELEELDKQGTLKGDEQTIFNQMKAEVEGPLTLVGDGHFHQEQFEVVNL